MAPALLVLVDLAVLLVVLPALALSALVLPVVPFTAAAFSFVAPPATFYPWLLATVLAYCLLTQWVKTRYIRRWHEWL